MGKTILTPKQLDFLELVQVQPSITKRFFLTEGTALSEFYFKHRFSEDIDLFSEKEVNAPQVEAFLKGISNKLGVKSIAKQNFLGLYTYKLLYSDGEELKVDFNYYPFPRIEKGMRYKSLAVDSIRDIAANKVHTLFMKPRLRDYVDLYFIMKSRHYLLRQVILDAKAKFDWDIDKVNLANQFVRVKDLKPEESPQIIVPFNRKEMENFFLGLAKSLGKDIFK